MKWYMDKEYVEKHLQGYIEFQLKQGYRLKDVEKALLKYGYDDMLVKEIIKKITPVEIAPNGKPNQKELNEELYMYIQNLLVDFIKKEQEQGYEIEVIRKALINYGHHPSMVKKAEKAMKQGRVTDFHKRIKMSGSLVLLISVALILGFMFFMVQQTNASLGIVVMSFAPAFVAVLLSYSITTGTEDKRLIRLVPVISVAAAVLVFILLIQFSTQLRKVSEPETILILNVLLAFVCGAMIALFSEPRKKRITVDDIAEPLPQEELLEEKINNTPVRPKRIFKPRKPRKPRMKIKDFDA